jgi:hypothetical protein
MRKRLGVLGSWAVLLVSIAILLFIAAEIIMQLGNCSYDDLPNTWSCANEWATERMYDFDVIIFLIAYPAAFLGIVLGLIKIVRRK